MIVLWSIKELSIGWMKLVVVLRELDVEILNPAQLSIDVSLLGELGVVWHPSSFNFILIIWVKLSLWIDHHCISILEILSEVLLQGKSQSYLNCFQQKKC